MFNADKYQSVVWEAGGRRWPRLDCYGVINMVRRDLDLEPLPDFTGVTKDGGGLDRNARAMMARMTRCAPEPGAVVACYSGSLVMHVAIVISLDGALHVLECNPIRNVTILPLARFVRRWVRTEFWKPQ